MAFTVTSVQEAESRRRREVWMQVLQSGRPDGAPYRFTDPTEDSHSPRWAPDGSILAFTSRRGEDPNTSWFVRIGGPGGEAFHIEGVRGGPTWSGDGRWIAYTFGEARGADDTGDTREGWVAPDAVSRTLSAERFDGRVVTSTRYKEDGELTLRAHFSVTPKAQLYVVSSSGGRPRQLTDVGFNVEDLSWAADARLHAARVPHGGPTRRRPRGQVHRAGGHRCSCQGHEGSWDLYDHEARQRDFAVEAGSYRGSRRRCRGDELAGGGGARRTRGAVAMAVRLWAGPARLSACCPHWCNHLNPCCVPQSEPNALTSAVE